MRYLLVCVVAVGVMNALRGSLLGYANIVSYLIRFCNPEGQATIARSICSSGVARLLMSRPNTLADSRFMGGSCAHGLVRAQCRSARGPNLGTRGNRVRPVTFRLHRR